MAAHEIDFRVISIGAMSANPLWGERSPVRTGHATTTLIRTAGVTILVDPGLPGTMLGPRLKERSGLDPEDVTHVFLTSYHPETHRGITLFEQAIWLIAKEEREGAGVPLVTILKRAMESPDPDAQLITQLQREVELLQKFQEAPQRLAPGVDIFPLFGVSPGCTGVLIGQDEVTTVICGDAIPTVEHFRRGMAPLAAADVTAAKSAFADACEVADLLILGRDNMIVNDQQARAQELRGEEFER
ncbi:hypothetical protein BH11PLA1_BH11PLA1_15140 [soil metagenome]